MNRYAIVTFCFSIFLSWNFAHASICESCPLPQAEQENCALVPYVSKKGVLGGLSAYSYNDDQENGPEEWAELNCESGDFEMFKGCSYCKQTCGGERQSPVDIDLKYSKLESIKKAPLFILAKSAEVTYSIKPLNYELSCSKGWCGSAKFDGEFFQLINIHFHAPAEHTVMGKLYPLEMHNVHISKQGNAMVHAVMFDYGEHNPALEEYLDLAEDRCTGKVNVQGLIGTANQRWRFISYLGSLTTPPCAEIVRFAASMNVQKASKEQIERYIKQVGGGPNNRPIQPLNGRKFQIFD